MVALMKWIDIPPVWLFAFLFATVALDTVLPDTLRPLRVPGAAMIALGLLLMVVAVVQMAMQRTSPIPHTQPSALVDSGIFGLSRNPIYRGDALVLAGYALWRETPFALVLVPLFMWIITRRFILPEEARLANAFGPSFAEYKTRVRRWI